MANLKDADPCKVNLRFAVAAGIAGLALLPNSSDTAAISIPMGSVFGDFTFVPDGLGVWIAIISTVALVRQRLFRLTT